MGLGLGSGLWMEVVCRGKQGWMGLMAWYGIDAMCYRHILYLSTLRSKWISTEKVSRHEYGCSKKHEACSGFTLRNGTYVKSLAQSLAAFPRPAP
jgi:hypothetical protein